MIIAMDGKCRYEGTTADLLVEFVGLMQGLYRHLKEKYGEEFANENIALCGRLAVMNDNDLGETLKALVEDFADIK